MGDVTDVHRREAPSSAEQWQHRARKTAAGRRRVATGVAGGIQTLGPMPSTDPRTDLLVKPKRCTVSLVIMQMPSPDAPPSTEIAAPCPVGGPSLPPGPTHLGLSLSSGLATRLPSIEIERELAKGALTDGCRRN